MTQLTEMKTSIIPSVLLSETHFAYCRRKDCIGDAVARVADDGFYGGVEIADIPDASERERIGSVVQAYGLRLIQWMSMVLVTENLNLSSLDESLRKQTVARMKGLTDQAAQCTASGFAVLSGPDPGPQLRKDATEQLYKSMCELAEALKQYHPMALILEPLDRDAHKNGLLGPTREVVELMARLRRQFPNVGVSWDTAHVALCDEDILQSFKTAHSYIRQIHLADAVLDRLDGLGRSGRNNGPRARTEPQRRDTRYPAILPDLSVRNRGHRVRRAIIAENAAVAGATRDRPALRPPNRHCTNG